MDAEPRAGSTGSPLVYVVTVTWNGRDDTIECLQSLGEMTYVNYRLLLVDNASEDGTEEVVRQCFPAVELVVNDRNLGFVGGFNVGLGHALSQGADYVLVINNDTVVASDMLDELMKEIGASEVGMVAPKIYYADPPDLIWSVGGDCHPWLLEMTHKGDNQWDKGQWEQVIDRDFLVGCALLLSRKLLIEVGMFDMLFFPAYYEDVDLCLRARTAGYRLLLAPRARMWHKISAATGGAGSPGERYLMARNSVRYFRKHVRGLRWLAVIPYRIGSAVKMVARLVLQGRRDSAWSYLRGLWDGVRLPMVPTGLRDCRD